VANQLRRPSRKTEIRRGDDLMVSFDPPQKPQKQKKKKRKENRNGQKKRRKEVEELKNARTLEREELT